MKHTDPIPWLPPKQAPDEDLGSLLVSGASEWGIGLGEGQVRACLSYLDLVLQTGKSLNLSSIASAHESIVKHFIDSLACLQSPRVRTACSIIDVGSGAGFPAVPLAIALAEANVVALESRAKKADFIRSAVQRCGVANVTVIAIRSEEAAQGELRDACDAAVCRALAPPEVSLELCLPFVRPGGILSVLCGEEDADDAGRLSPVANALGAAPPEGILYRLPITGHRRGLIEVQKTSPTPLKFPRRPGLAKKRPLLQSLDRGK